MTRNFGHRCKNGQLVGRRWCEAALVTVVTALSSVFGAAGCGGGSGGGNSTSVTNPTASIDAVAYQITPNHTGAITFQSVSLPSGSLWSVNLDFTPSFALIAEGLIFVTATTSVQGANVGTSELLALDQATGATAWGPVAIAAVNASAAYDQGRIFVINSLGGVQAFEASNGNAAWSTTLTGPTDFISGITALNGYVYVSGGGGLLGGELYALSETTGAVAWTQAVDYGLGGVAAVTSSGVYVAYPCHSYDFNATSGAPIWNYVASCFGGGGGTPVVANGIAYMPLSSPPSGNLSPVADLTFNAASGAIVSSYLADNPPAIGPTTGYFVQSSTLRAIALNSGAVLWSFPGDGYLTTSPILVNNYVFVASEYGNLYGVDATSGVQVWHVNVGPGIPASLHQTQLPIFGMSAGDGLLIVPSGYATLTAFQLSTNP